MIIKSPSIHLSQPFSKAPAVPAGLHTNHICSVFISGNKQALRSGSQNVLRTFRNCSFWFPECSRNVSFFCSQNIPAIQECLGGFFPEHSGNVSFWFPAMFVFGFQNVLAMLVFFVCSQNILGMLVFGSQNVRFWFPEHCRNVRFIYFISGNVRFWFQEC